MFTKLCTSGEVRPDGSALRRDPVRVTIISTKISGKGGSASRGGSLSMKGQGKAPFRPRSKSTG